MDRQEHGTIRVTQRIARLDSRKEKVNCRATILLTADRNVPSDVTHEGTDLWDA